MIGFRFHDDYVKDREDNIFICHGTCLAKNTPYRDHYLSHAVIPTQNWQPLGHCEHPMLSDIHHGDSGRTLFVLQLKNQSMTTLAELARTRCLHALSVQEIQGLFAQAVEPHVQGLNWEHYLGLETTQDAAPTLTWDEEGRRTGLHIDSWHTLPIANRSQAPNRLCLNLGPGDRFFILLNLGVDHMRAQLRQGGQLAAEEDENPTGIVTSYLHAHRHSTLIALRTRPGEAYIAPTEYICHDGFVPDREANASISIMGHITPNSSTTTG